MAQLFLRVVCGGQETTLTVDRIISINDQMYNEHSHPPESNTLDRIVILENAVSNLTHDLREIVGWLEEQDKARSQKKASRRKPNTPEPVNPESK